MRVDEKRTLLPGLGHRGVRTDEAFWGLAWDRFDILDFRIIGLVEVSHV
jgi:hypothetical protein